MAFYVLALTDTPLPRWRVADRTFASVRLTKGIYAVGQDRGVSPEPSEEELRFQHAAVVALAGRVSAILPVRFGALQQRSALRRLVSEHEDTILAALDDVRGRVQMTIRVLGRRRRAILPGSPPASGRQYLEARQRAADHPLPPAAARIVRALRPWAVQERREAGAGQLLARVYHLVNANDLRRYRKAAAGHAAAGTILTGPWPPFAFTPKLF